MLHTKAHSDSRSAIQIRIIFRTPLRRQLAPFTATSALYFEYSLNFNMYLVGGFFLIFILNEMKISYFFQCGKVQTPDIHQINIHIVATISPLDCNTHCRHGHGEEVHQKFQRTGRYPSWRSLLLFRIFQHWILAFFKTWNKQSMPLQSSCPYGSKLTVPSVLIHRSI